MGTFRRNSELGGQKGSMVEAISSRTLNRNMISLPYDAVEDYHGRTARLLTVTSYVITHLLAS